MFTEMANILLITFTCVYEINNIQSGLQKQVQETDLSTWRECDPQSMPLAPCCFIK